MIKPELSESISRMIFKNDDEPNGMTAAEWIRTYVDLDNYVAECGDDDDLWDMARVIEEDALISGCDEIDVGEMMRALLERR